MNICLDMICDICLCNSLNNLVPPFFVSFCLMCPALSYGHHAGLLSTFLRSIVKWIWLLSLAVHSNIVILMSMLKITRY